MLSASFALSGPTLQKDCKVSSVYGDIYPKPDGVTTVFLKNAVLLCGKEKVLVTLQDEVEPLILAALSGKLRIEFELTSASEGKSFREIGYLAIY